MHHLHCVCMLKFHEFRFKHVSLTKHLLVNQFTHHCFEQIIRKLVNGRDFHNLRQNIWGNFAFFLIDCGLGSIG